MPNFGAALEIFVKKGWNRQERLEKYTGSTNLAETADKAEFRSPVMDKFFAKNRNRAIMTVIDFNLSGFVAVGSQIYTIYL